MGRTEDKLRVKNQGTKEEERAGREMERMKHFLRITFKNTAREESRRGRACEVQAVLLAWDEARADRVNGVTLCETVCNRRC